VIIAIDGPAGSGKSTTALAVAQKLGFRHLDSGAFYRALTHVAQRASIPPDQWVALSPAELDSFGVHARSVANTYHLFAGDDDVTEHLRTPQVNGAVSEMARVPEVRNWLLGRLREAAVGNDLVADGRDIGTVVFPDAEVKVFLVADPEVRARRRLMQTGFADPSGEDVDAETGRLLERDAIDSGREVAPLVRAPDAVLIDTSRVPFEAQVDQIVKLAQDRLPERGSAGAVNQSGN
jgi:CMP/dCMP kinase